MTDCEGCILKSECSMSSLMENVDHEKCPCVICLVKPACQKDCDDFVVFRLKYSPYYNGSY
jgi:hypothetical protein